MVRDNNESGYLIEWHHNGELRYWSGGGFDQDTCFELRSGEAVRFARERDAAAVLAHCLRGRGRVALHVWGTGKEARRGE